MKNKKKNPLGRSSKDVTDISKDRLEVTIKGQKFWVEWEDFLRETNWMNYIERGGDPKLFEEYYKKLRKKNEK